MTLSLNSLIAAEGTGHHLSDYAILFYAGLSLAVIVAVLLVARKGFQERVFKNPVSQASEQMYLFIESLAVGVVGQAGKKYVPFLLTLWLFIFTSNILGLFLPHTPTASWSWNLGLAIVVFVYVQIEGVKANGALGHVGHFAGPKLVDWKRPFTYFFLLITMLILVVEILGEFIKIVSLSLRLYGNISGGHLVKGSLDSIVQGVPLGALVMPLEILVAIIQALVFTMLSAIYLSLVTHHEEDHGSEEGHGDDHRPATAEATH